MKLGLVSLCAAALIISSLFCGHAGFCTESQPATQIITGSVTAVDPSAATITIRYTANEETQTYDEMVIAVPTTATIEKGEAALTLSEVSVGSEVMAEYVTDDSGKPTTNYIMVQQPVEAMPAVEEASTTM